MKHRIVVLLTLVLVGAACSTSDPGARGNQAATFTFPVTVTAANGEVTIDQRPEAIVSLSPTATEILFGIGAGDQVVAVDDQSNFPPEAPTTDLSGFTPNIEAIAEFDPDLVVISNDIDDLLASLEALDIPVLLQQAAQTLEDTYAQIEQLGAATGNAGAAELVQNMQVEIDQILASVEQPDEPPTYYHELDATFFTVTSSTFLGEIYSLLGLENIADPADADGTGFPQLSAEFIVEQDPDLIFLADVKCCGESAETVAKRPGWGQITAVKNGAVFELDDDVASRWGPRVVDLLQTVALAVDQERARTP